MHLSFMPGDLHLFQGQDGVFIVKLAQQEILATRSRRSALSKFNALRAEFEKLFPVSEPTKEERAALLQREINNSLIGHNSLGGRKKKKSSAGNTRTFGG